jgi:hypothetical protein
MSVIKDKQKELHFIELQIAIIDNFINTQISILEACNIDKNSILHMETLLLVQSMSRKKKKINIKKYNLLNEIKQLEDKEYGN